MIPPNVQPSKVHKKLQPECSHDSRVQEGNLLCDFWTSGFFEPLLVFGLFWHDRLVVANCIFLEVYRFEWFPYERDIPLCFVFSFSSF